MKMSRRSTIISGVALGLLPSLANAAETRTYYYMVFDEPVAGKEKEFNQFYDSRHIYDLTSVPGFLSGQRFIRNEPQMFSNGVPKLPTYLTLYKIVTDDLEGVFAEIARRSKSGQIIDSPVTNDEVTSSYVYTPASSAQSRSIPQPAEFSGQPYTSYCLIIFTKPVAGKDAEWRTWYDTVHSPEILGWPGFLTAQRLTLARSDVGSKIPPTENALFFTIQMPTSRPVNTPLPPPPPGPPRPQDSSATRGYTSRQIGPLVESAKGGR